MTLVLLSGDLMVVSRVEGAAARLGTAVKAVSSGSQAVDFAAAGEEANVVIIDLSLPSVEVAAVVDQLKSSEKTPIQIIAFGPHVHEQRLAAAREAGCDLVVSRGQFFAQLDAILEASQ